jgi:tRNA A37 threonylcarbamoyladenosine synthetase subunit TsaC/SUA5/YrdC
MIQMPYKHSPANVPTLYLTATDTTIGFVTQDAARLDAVKGRPPHKHYIRAVDSLATLQRHTRVPPRHRNRLRRARRTTFILPDGRSWRVIHEPRHQQLISEMGGWAYTTSANRSGEPYDEAWARSVADRVIEPLEAQAAPSTILRINHRTLKKLR